jgi:hypothetical protein
LSGKTQIDLKLRSNPGKTTISTDIFADGISLNDVLNRLKGKVSPLMFFLGLDEKSKIQGDIHFIPDQKLDINNAVLTDATGKSAIHISGAADLKANTGKFAFTGNDLSLTDAEKGLNNSVSTNSHSKNNLQLWLPPKEKFEFAGTADIAATFEGDSEREKTEGHCRLKDASISTSGGSLSTQKVNGQIHFTDNKVTFEHVHGNIASGTFELNGSILLNGEPSMNLQFQSNGLELTQLETVLKMFKVNVPLFANHQLYGKVKEIELKISGSTRDPEISFHAFPQDLYYQPPGLAKPLRAVSGNIVYNEDTLKLDDVCFVSHDDKIIASLIIDHLSTAANLQKIKAKTSGVNLPEINYYLSSSLMPPPLKKLYVDFLNQYKLSSIHGRVYGNVLCQLETNKVYLDGVINLINAGAKVTKEAFPVEHLSGMLAASGEELTMQDLSGSIRDSHFSVDGHISDYMGSNPHWRSVIRAVINPQELVDLVPTLTDQFNKWNVRITSSGPLTLNANGKGENDSMALSFSMNADAPNHVIFSGPFGTFHKPAGSSLVFDGSLKSDQTGFKIDKSRILLGDSLIEASAQIERGQPDQIHIHLGAPNAVPAHTLVSIICPQIGPKEVSGQISGALNIDGSTDNPKGSGYIACDQLSLPSFNMSNLTGRIDLLDQAESAGGRAQKAKLDIPKVTFGRLNAKNFVANLTIEPVAGHLKEPKIAIKDGVADVAGGKVSIDGQIDMNEHSIAFNTKLAKLKAAQLSDELFNYPGEISGLTDGRIDFETQGADYNTMIQNLDGSGSMIIEHGNVTRFGHLQARLTQANLLHQGLFGFNLNNLLQSVVPVRTGQFKNITAQFQIANGVLSAPELRYNGDDMRMWGAAKANLPLNTLEMEVAGKIPRVSTSMIGGPVGEASRSVTIQKMVNVVTKHKLENLPTLPLLGDIGDRPRTFSFKVLAPLDKPKVVAQSIEKTFHWIPSKPTASAHPVPSI